MENTMATFEHVREQKKAINDYKILSFEEDSLVQSTPEEILQKQFGNEYDLDFKQIS